MKNPILIKIYRGKVLESFHRGSIVAVNHHQKTLEVGNIHQTSYPRSALKLFQHIPLLLSGAMEKYGFGYKELAIMCGSHNGEESHTKLVTDMIAKIGLTPDALKCGPQAPTLFADKAKLIKADKMPASIHNNCSGKHAGFLAYCVFHNLSTDNYLDKNHPLQIAIKETSSKFYEYEMDKIQTGIDGCSAPVYAFPLINQAIAYRNLVAPGVQFSPQEKAACKMVVEAVTKYPHYVAGKTRYCTELMNLSNGTIVGKTGADGVYCLAIPESETGIAIKIDDGKMGPQYTVTQYLIAQNNLLSPTDLQKLKKFEETENYNFAKNHTGKTCFNEKLSVLFK